MKNCLLLLVFFSLFILLLISIMPRAWLVETRNFLFFESIEQLNTIKIDKTKKNYFHKVFMDETSIRSFDDLFYYRKGRLRNKGFSNKTLFSARVNDCFGNNNTGLMCGCSDISEIVTAFCISQDNECIEVVKSSTHSIVYNRTNNYVIDLFYGYVFYGSINELLLSAKNQNLLNNKDFLTLGHYIPKHNKIIDIEVNDKLNIKDITYKKLTEEEIDLVERKYSNKSWEELILNSLGTDLNKLKVQKNQYYWDGSEFIYPLINKIQFINDNLYRSLKEFTGYILINKNLIFTK